MSAEKMADAKEYDEQLEKLAIEVSEAKDSTMPNILTKLNEIIKSTSPEDLPHLKRDIWSLDLLQMIVLTLKQEYGANLNGWKTASLLIGILGKCVIGLTLDDNDDFIENFLPSVIEKTLYVARKIQQRFIKTSKMLADSKANLLMYFNNVLDSLTSILGAYGFLSINVLKSPWLQQMFMTEDPETCILTMGVIQSTNRMKHDIMKVVGEDVTTLVLDELVFKISTTQEESIAASATRTLLVICDCHPPFVKHICNRYSLDNEDEPEKGLRPILNRWENSGFGRDLRRLLLLLESGSAQKAELVKYAVAAVKIQAAWKSHYTRKKLKKADQAFSKFQRSYRAKKQSQEEQREERRLQLQLRHQLILRRRKAMRDLHTRRLHAMEILPSGEINKFLQKEQHECAIKIQAWYKGHLVRKSFKEKYGIQEKTSAAIKLQRGVRQWLKRVKAKKAEPPAWQRPPGLTDQRRVELMENITKRREDHPVRVQTDDERKQLHEKVQSLLKQHAMRSRIIRKKEHQRNNMLAVLDFNSSLLVDAPKLKEADEKDIENYRSTSVPIATKARRNHQDALRLLQQPWWRKLEDEEEIGDDHWLNLDLQINK